MKIGIDTRWIRSGDLSGIGVWTIELIKRWSNLKEHKFVLVCENEEKASLVNGKINVESYPNVESLIIGYPVLTVKDFLFTSRTLNKLNLDIFLSLSQPCYHPFRNYKLVSFVHDIIPITHKGLYDRWKFKTKLFYSTKLITNWLLNSSDYLLTNSMSTKKSIINELKIKEDKLEFVYPGVNEVFFESQNESSFLKVKEKYKLPERYILFLGRFDPMKNLDTLIKAYARLPVKIRKDFKLVLGGSKTSKYYSRVESLIERENLSSYIRAIGYVESKDINMLYSGASIFVFPSIIEGFGLPVVEAMASGVPVVISDIETLKEVAGEAAFTFEVKNTESLKDLLASLLTNRVKRTSLVPSGQDRARSFTWQKSSEKTLKLISSIV